MNFLVVGHLCYDEIQYSSGEKSEGFGGIYYAITSLAALASLAGKDHSVIPVFPVGEDMRDELFDRLKNYPNISTEGIYTIDQPTNRVKLFYSSQAERIECSEFISPPISFEAIRPWVRKANAILINMISGFDITYDTLYAINETGGSHEKPIYFDFHSLTLGIDENHKRFRQPLVEWRRWAFYMDIVQMNQIEASTLTTEKLSHDQLAKTLLSLGPRALVITRGERGVKLYYDDRKKTLEHEIPGIDPSSLGIEADGDSGIVNQEQRDPTGCGDVFGAAFIFRYAMGGSLIAAAEFANTVAAGKVLIAGSDGMQRLTHVAVPFQE
jgi:sugar/nucleoside kinase (ribokinase family)